MGGEGASARAWEQKQGTENNELCSLPWFVLHDEGLITPSAVMPPPASPSCSLPQITTLYVHPKDRGRHHACIAMCKWLAFHSFFLNLTAFHLPCFGNIITRESNMFPGLHDQEICPAPLLTKWGPWQPRGTLHKQDFPHIFFFNLLLHWISNKAKHKTPDYNACMNNKE